SLAQKATADRPERSKRWRRCRQRSSRAGSGRRPGRADDRAGMRLLPQKRASLQPTHDVKDVIRRAVTLLSASNEEVLGQRGPPSGHYTPVNLSLGISGKLLLKHGRSTLARSLPPVTTANLITNRVPNCRVHVGLPECHSANSYRMTS